MHITVIGVPSSAGAYCVGVENAPAALRSAGLIDALRIAGNDVDDIGDLTTRRWTPDREHPLAQNVMEESRAIVELRDAASPLLLDGNRLLVLGGSCSVAVGLCAAVARTGVQPHLVYIDRHLDLNTPETTAEGSLSWMGIAHALGLEGAAPELLEALGETPVLETRHLSYLGVDVTQATDGERQQLRRLGVSVVAQSELTTHPAAAARQACEALPGGPFVVHLDVDVLDFLDAPIAENVNGRNSGPTLSQLQPALAELLRHPECLGLSIGQLDPAHAASDPTAIPRLIAVLAEAMTVRPTTRRSSRA